MLPRFVGRESNLALAVCALLFWAPLPAGSVTPAGQLVFRLAVCALFLLATATAKGVWRWRGTGMLPVAALAGIAALGFVQSCPWPAALAAVVSPEHAALAVRAAELAGASEPPSFVPLAVDAAAARSAALSWLATAALLAAALVCGRTARHRRWMLAALVGAALVQLGLGMLGLRAASPDGLTAVLLRPEGRLRGSFANPNHLSLLFEIAMAAVAAWSWVALSRLRRTGGRPRVRALLPPLLWLLLLAGVVLTGSRAGLAAAVLGSVAQMAALLLAGRGRGRVKAAAAVGLLLLVGLGALLALGSRLEIRRYETASIFESNLRSRLLLAAPAVELWQRFPISGTGLGTFEDAFPMAVPAELAPVLWNRAHNDPLELLVTGGAIGLALGLLALAAALPAIWRGLRRGERLEDRAAGVAAVGALGAAGLHELFDFGLVIPANALALVVVLGSAMAAGAVVQTARRAAAPAEE